MNTKAKSRTDARRCIATVLCALSISSIAPAAHAAEVLTNNYDAARTGANLAETQLETANVAPETFGRLFHYDVDGPVYAQPLVATGVETPNGARDVAYVATASNSVYAFDANYPAATPGETLWRRALNRLPDGKPARVTGIFGTPVIDRARNTLYVVAGLMQDENARFVLHALDLAEGRDRPGSPVAIAASVRVDDTQVSFAPSATRIAVQRAGLALARAKLIVAFGGDYFEGWVFAFDTADLAAPPAAFCTTCASRVQTLSGVDFLNRDCILLGPGGGIWQAGRAPAVSASGKVYFFTGNKQHVIKDGCRIPRAENACAVCATPEGCVCEGNRSAQACRGPDACIANAARDAQVFDTNEALIELDPAAGLKLTGWFRPQNWNAAGVDGLEFNDLDLGGSGPLLLPADERTPTRAARLIGGGKQGVMYLLDTAARTQACSVSATKPCLAPPLQSFALAPIPPKPKEFYRHILGGPVLWARASAQGGARAFVWRVNDHLRSYRVGDTFEDCDTANPAPTTTHNCASVAHSTQFIDHHPGGILALSANGVDAASAIVWAATSRAVSGPGKLMAYKALPDAATPTQLTKLWDSDDCEGDAIALAADFVPPTVANGRVYMATAANQVVVYGIIERRECVPQAQSDSFGPFLQ
jgi:hypothetical protein